MAPSSSTTELGSDVLALQAASRLVVATSLGHEGLCLRRAEEGEGYELVFDDGRTMPAWDGLLLDVAARQVAGGCRPDFEKCVADECRKCLATLAAQQTHVTGARSVLEDICQSASHDVDRFDGAIVTVMRELLLRGEVGQDFARDAMWG